MTQHSQNDTEETRGSARVTNGTDSVSNVLKGWDAKKQTVVVCGVWCVVVVVVVDTNRRGNVSSHEQQCSDNQKKKRISNHSNLIRVKR
jgi:hypothetical protein